jgi:hypothetical protein
MLSSLYIGDVFKHGQQMETSSKSADFLHNIQQFEMKNPQNGNNSFTAIVNFFKKLNMNASLK